MWRSVCRLTQRAAASASLSNTPANVRCWHLTHPRTVSVTFDFCYYRAVQPRCFIWPTCANWVRTMILRWAPCPRDAVCFSQCSKNQLCMHLCVSDKQTHSSTLPPAASVAMLPQVSRGCAVGWSQCRNQFTAMEPNPPSLHSYGANKGNDRAECFPGTARKHKLEKAVASMSGRLSLNLSSSRLAQLLSWFRVNDLHLSQWGFRSKLTGTADNPL